MRLLIDAGSSLVLIVLLAIVPAYQAIRRDRRARRARVREFDQLVEHLRASNNEYLAQTRAMIAQRKNRRQ